jgi:hypothetical protein
VRQVLTDKDIRAALLAAYMRGRADRILDRDDAMATVDRLLRQLSRPDGISEARSEFDRLRGGNVVTLRKGPLN